MLLQNFSKFFFSICIVIISKGQGEISHYDSIQSNEDIINKLLSYDELVKNLERKLIELETEVQKKSAEIEILKIKLEDQDRKDDTTTQVPATTTTPDDSVEERLEHLEELSKIHTLRSCHEYDEYGINTSGKYFIDPDGPLIGIEPFEVYCNFEDQSTEILHDYDGKTVEIDHCTEPHVCFRLDLTYPTKMEQIVSLIDLSENCTQSIRFNCFLAPLEVNGEAIGTWVNRNNGNETYYTGANSGTHICECGITETCSDSEHQNTCNCDASELPIEQFDAGILTDMTALPVTGFNYGDLLQFPDQYASIEIGRLKCNGKKPLLPEEINDSCKNLKLNGESRSRNYALNDGSLAFCDMTKRITDSEIQKKLGDFRFEEPMFNALNDKIHDDGNGTVVGYHIPEGTIMYDHTLFDEEKKMNLSSGIYTAPKEGVYLFGVDAHKCSGNALAQIDAIHNGKIIKTISHSDATPESTQLTSFWSVEMKAGDTIYLTNKQATSLYTLGTTYIFSFIGFFLS